MGCCLLAENCDSNAHLRGSLQLIRADVLRCIRCPSIHQATKHCTVFGCSGKSTTLEQAQLSNAPASLGTYLCCLVFCAIFRHDRNGSCFPCPVMPLMFSSAQLYWQSYTSASPMHRALWKPWTARPSPESKPDRSRSVSPESELQTLSETGGDDTI